MKRCNLVKQDPIQCVNEVYYWHDKAEDRSGQFVKYDEANKLLIEFARHISKEPCNCWSLETGKDKHHKECIVLKSEQYLKENK